MRIAALRGIRFYQRYLSPLKGFSCAYRIHTGKESCSAYGYRMIERFGLQKGWGLLRRRMQACAQVACDCRTSRTAAMTRRRALQAGYCDVPSCDAPSCDLPSCDLPSCDIGLPDWCGDALDIADGCSGCSGCDGCGRRRKQSDRDGYVTVRPTPSRVPPRSGPAPTDCSRPPDS
jgi:putative component of membrane protein insertase Oxa1/YidC/SpoIIIJ protein YidD